MSRYIDADKFKEWYAKNIIHDDVFDRLVDMQPTADVRDNVHGEWVGALDYCIHLAEKTGERYSPSGIENMIYCNWCWQASDRKSNFCPNCGADMRKEVEG